MATVFDIEVTNRCNAKCHFCPRDRTPHQGMMTPEVFSQALQRVGEYRAASESHDPDVTISLCGLGEPLLNRHVFDYVRQAREAGFRVTMSSNGSLLDERRSARLLQAGLQEICINVGDEGDDYEAVYGLPFPRTLENVVRFNELADGICQVLMVLVDHHDDEDHIVHMKDFWLQRGLHRALSYKVMNRGGSLFVDHQQYETYPELAEAKARLADEVETPLCGAPFAYLFVGYDGQYYMCCSDWEKQAPLGSVYDESFVGVMDIKLEHLASREPVCRTCNLDPINRLTEELRSEAQGQVPAGSSDAMIASIAADNRTIGATLAHFGREVPEAPRARQIIPVRAV